MSEVDIRREQTEKPEMNTALAVWAESAKKAASVAVSLARTPFVPQSLREKPRSTSDEDMEYARQVTAANITAAILTGQEIGIQPMAALRSIDVIQGTPAMRAIAMRGLVQAAGHDVWVEEQTNTRAIVKGQRKGSDKVQVSTWTIDRAKQLGLVNKDNWRKQPQAMLVARATAECCRLVAADVLLGMPYAIEELGDDLPANGTDAAAPKKRTARRKPVTPAEAMAEPTPELDRPEPEQPKTETPKDEPVLQESEDDAWSDEAAPTLDGDF